MPEEKNIVEEKSENSSFGRPPEKEGIGGMIGIVIIILILIAAACYFYIDRMETAKQNAAASIRAEQEFEQEVQGDLEAASSTSVDPGLDSASKALSK